MNQNAFDESKMEIKYGIFINSDLFSMQLSTLERKLFECFQKKDPRLSQEAQNEIHFYMKNYPYLISLGFGTTAAICLYLLDHFVQNRYQETAQPTKPSQPEPKPMTEAEKILQEKVLSKKQIKASMQSGKLDYYQASKAMGDIGPKVEPLVLRLGKFRYLAIFGAFYMMGLMHGNLRSRVKLYGLCKKYEKDLEGYTLVDFAEPKLEKK